MLNFNTSAHARKDGKGLTAKGRELLCKAHRRACERKRYGQRLHYDYPARLANVGLAAAPGGFLPLGPVDEQHARGACQAKNPRKKNITRARPGIKTGWSEALIEYRGKFRGYRGSEYIPTMQSLYRISVGGAQLAAVIDGAHFVLPAPRGYVWRAVNGCPALVQLASGAEYHIDSGDVRAGALHCRAQLLAMLGARKAQGAGNAALLRTLAKSAAAVDVELSRLAGNCYAGTCAFAVKLGLDPAQSYPVSAVIKAYKKARGVTEFERERFLRVLAIVAKKLKLDLIGGAA